MGTDLIFHQLFEKETSTYTYLLGDNETKEAILIDPVIEMVDRDLGLIEELGLKLKYILDTHVHADHITGSGEIRKRTGAQAALSGEYGNTCPDLALSDGSELKFGKHIIKAISTPGHTAGCMTFLIEDMAFTGDALLVRGCGRTDFQQGSSEKLFASVRGKLFTLPDETTVYPAHDYKGFTKTSIGAEKSHNPRLAIGILKEEFIDIMAGLRLAYPNKIQQAVPANMKCGISVDPERLVSVNIDGVPTVTPEELHAKLPQVRIIDIRSVEEYNGALGHIPSAQLSSMGPELTSRLESEDKSENIVFVCTMGRRSAEATKMAQNQGFERVYSLQGGMEAWREQNFHTERDMGGS